MKELLLVFLVALPHAAKAKDGDIGGSSAGSSQITLVISERIVVKEDPKTKKMELQKTTNVPVKKIEMKDKKGNKVIVYVPEL